MPPWLPEVAVVIVGMACSSLVTIAVLGERIKNLGNWMKAMDEDIDRRFDAKVDRELHHADVRHLDGRISGAFEEISRERHRVNNLEQRRAT